MCPRRVLHFFGFLGSVRTEVVRFVGCGGLATSLAPGRGTYRLVRSAAFQGCKDRRKILKWRHMRAFSGYVSEWCGRADAARLLPQQPPSGRAAAARTQAAAAPAAAQRPGRIRLAAGQHPPRPNGCWPVPERTLPNAYVFFICCRLRVSRCSIDAAGFRPRTRRWALALRPEHHPRSDQSGHTERSGRSACLPKEPHAQRSWHLQRSPPAQSEDLPPEEW